MRLEYQPILQFLPPPALSKAVPRIFKKRGWSTNPFFVRRMEIERYSIVIKTIQLVAAFLTILLSFPYLSCLICLALSYVL
jgi:hypothetical protein